MRKEAIRNARKAKGYVGCQMCGVLMKENAKIKDYQVDHIEPASEPAALIRSWDSFFERLFCPATGLWVLCKGCHDVKTKAENEERDSHR